MSRADGVKITETSLSIFGEGHAPCFEIGRPLIRDGVWPTAIIVAVQSGTGFRPVRLLLPHQLYTDDARQLLIDHGARELWVYPIYDSMLWTQVDVENAQDHLWPTPAQLEEARFQGRETARSEIALNYAQPTNTGDRTPRGVSDAVGFTQLFREVSEKLTPAMDELYDRWIAAYKAEWRRHQEDSEVDA